MYIIRKDVSLVCDIKVVMCLSVDLQMDYHQVPFSEDDRWKIAFVIPLGGLYQCYSDGVLFSQRLDHFLQNY